VRTLDAMLHDGRLFAYFVLEGDPVRNADELKYVSNNLTDDALRDWYSGATTRVVRKLRIADAKIDPDTARHIQEGIDFKAQQVTATGAVEDVKGEQKANKFAPVAFVYLLWIAVFTAAQMLLTNTVEEKSNRIIEVLLSSVSPSQLMAGKIWGIGATGLTIILSWAVFGLIASTSARR
jgi:ABC-2 type transport system permease protein